ncbi:hypothetical protein M3Y94_00855700 [Aphelenchoides besseyi]|nr:hypothetical protein M3Y94_00855700 [Aphelenchoides besseyi]KAI6226788.1 hypothetical protein M3Y95_00657800 [Aphelenchoides besseyi]
MGYKKDSSARKFCLPGFIRVIPHTLKQTGRYCDGRFDPDHLDFQSFCGFFHTQNSILPLTVLFLLYLTMLATMFGILRVFINVTVSLFFVPFVILSIVGILTKKETFMLPAIFVLMIGSIITLISIPMTVAAVFDSNLLIYRIYDSANKGDTDSQLTLLLTVITNTFTFLFMIYMTWSSYVHVCFIRGCRQVDEKKVDKEELEATEQVFEDHKCNNCYVVKLENDLKKKHPKVVV